MFEALLFDLDGTMLDLDIDVFLKHYFKAMMEHASVWGYHEGSFLVDQLWKCTELMIVSTDPATTNEEVFMTAFLKAMACEEERVYSFFESFYTERFPELKSLCQPYDIVPEILDMAFAKGYPVAVATNPVFPEIATRQRLEWARISHYPFKLVTTYENMHFCKPRIQYYEEVAALLNAAPSACLMAGNDTREDLVASQIGMKTFLVRDGLIDRGDGYKNDWNGHLTDLRDFIAALPAIRPGLQTE